VAAEVTLRVAKGEKAARAKADPMHPEEPGGAVARAVTGARLERPALPALRTSVALAELVELVELVELEESAVRQAPVGLVRWEGSEGSQEPGPPAPEVAAREDFWRDR
jgi:hypothetical protein